jgi:hypothetical protein
MSSMKFYCTGFRAFVTEYTQILGTLKADYCFSHLFPVNALLAGCKTRKSVDTETSLTHPNTCSDCCEVSPCHTERRAVAAKLHASAPKYLNRTLISYFDQFFRCFT